MRLLPRSLFGRLLVTATAATVVALLVAAFVIGHVLERFVTHGLDERLDAQILVLARAVGPDGRVDPGRSVDLPPYDRPGSGWAWEIAAPGMTLRSGSLGQANIVPDIYPHPYPPAYPQPGPQPIGADSNLVPCAGQGPDAGLPPSSADRQMRRRPSPNPLPCTGEGSDFPRDGARIAPFDSRDPRGRRVHGRMLTIATAQGPVRLLATAPRAIVERPLRAAMTPLLLSLLALGGAMALAVLLQLRIGLRPLGTLRAALAEVRAGRREHLDATEPAELMPLVGELNALIDANRSALAQARGHVANLAHGLKTPLAGLRLDLAGRDPDGRLSAHVDRIDAHVRHHLGRARAASDAGAGRVATALAPHMSDLVAALARIHADRAIRAEVMIDPALAVRCDPQDLDEMLGNLLDNGWIWARSCVTIGAEARGRDIAIHIADDGPGLPPDQLARATEPGWRLDESSPGHGFGLTIARELAELHGGRLELADRGAGRGLLATVVLPAA